jgi:hypothetical protein
VHGSPGDTMVVGWPPRAGALFVPDGAASEALKGGFLGNVNGLFPAPLHAHDVSRTIHTHTYIHNQLLFIGFQSIQSLL